jgi:hypothetical protein
MRYGEYVSFKNRIWLTTSSDYHCGYLQLNNTDEMHSFDKTETGKSCATSMELVATCKGYARDIFAFGKDWDNELNTRVLADNIQSEDDIYYVADPTDCYFVLWIEWVDGVAYRKACGTVVAEAWEQEKEEELVDLILG